MQKILITDFLSLLLFTAAFSLVWKERIHFYSLKPLLPALGLLSIGHVCEMLLEHSNVFAFSDFVQLAPGSSDLLIAVAGNITEPFGIGALMYGFIKIIKHERLEEKHIHDLEALLPLCANCKKYRTRENQWMPIENYLIESGAPPLTHGICPECAAKLYGYVPKPKA